MDKKRKERKQWTKDEMREKHANKIFIGNSDTKANFLKAKKLKTRYQDIKFSKYFFRKEMCRFMSYCNIKEMYMSLYIFQCFASLFSLVAEKLLKYSIALGPTLLKLSLHSLHICMTRKTYVLRYFLNRIHNILSWYYIIHVFHPSLTHLSE